jgi:hypothetical protein
MFIAFLFLQLLGELVEKSGYSPQAAAELHKQLYRTKLQQLVAKKKLSQDEQEELKRIRRILCIPADVASQVGAAIRRKQRSVLVVPGSVQPQ